jgi:hypothetical protein
MSQNICNMLKDRLFINCKNVCNKNYTNSTEVINSSFDLNKYEKYMFAPL